MAEMILLILLTINIILLMVIGLMLNEINKTLKSYLNNLYAVEESSRAAEYDLYRDILGTHREDV